MRLHMCIIHWKSDKLYNSHAGNGNQVSIYPNYTNVLCIHLVPSEDYTCKKARPHLARVLQKSLFAVKVSDWSNFVEKLHYQFIIFSLWEQIRKELEIQHQLAISLFLTNIILSNNYSHIYRVFCCWRRLSNNLTVTFSIPMNTF